MRSEIGQPPGSRVSTTSKPRFSRYSRSSAIWVDLPQPSLPSSVKNRPRGDSPPSRYFAMSESSPNTAQAPAPANSPGSL